MTLVGVSVDDLNLAVLDIGEAIGWIARPGEKGSGGISHGLTRGAQGRDMRGRQRRPLHLAQVGSDRLHCVLLFEDANLTPLPLPLSEYGCSPVKGTASCVDSWQSSSLPNSTLALANPRRYPPMFLIGVLTEQMQSARLDQ